MVAYPSRRVRAGMTSRQDHSSRACRRRTGHRGGTGLSPRTVEYVHAILHKAFRDAVVVDQVLASNPAERAKRPRAARHELGEVHELPRPEVRGEELRRTLALPRVLDTLAERNIKAVLL